MRHAARPGINCTQHRVASARLVKVHSGASNGVVTTAAPTDVSALQSELARLRAENEVLKQQLAGIRGQAAAPAIAPPAPVPAPVKPADPITVLDPANITSYDFYTIKAHLSEGVAWPTRGEYFWQRNARQQPFPLQLKDSAPIYNEKDQKQLHIVHVAAELAPIGKVGGLGDVVQGLSKACLERGHHVQVIMPFYESLDEKQIEGLKHEMDIEVPKGFMWDGEMRVGPLRTSVYWGRVDGIPVYFIRPADKASSNIFRGNRIYGGSYDDREAYLFMCRAALEWLRISNQHPHIIQVHDWHTAALPLLFWEVYHAEGMSKPRIVLTIHNLDNTGECRQDEFIYTGLPGEPFATIDKALDERTIGHNPERLNLMKGGIIYSNAVTTVSPTYAKDILTAGAGGFLKPIFNQEHVREKFHGILNGVDARCWCPATDVLLPANFNAELPTGKAVCKEYLQQGLGLAVDPSKPLVAVVSRLVNQKNPVLMAAAAGICKDLGAQFVLLGSGGQDAGMKRQSEGEYRDDPDVRLLIMYNEALSHLIYAAADMVLVPSNFEPCGLTQMLAMRYGALPVVRRTGGLADTVRDVDTWPGAEVERNGYTFDGTDVGSMQATLSRAINMFKSNPEKWNLISQNNMRADVSWALPAKEYVKLYNSISQPW